MISKLWRKLWLIKYTCTYFEASLYNLPSAIKQIVPFHTAKKNSTILKVFKSKKIQKKNLYICVFYKSNIRKNKPLISST